MSSKKRYTIIVKVDQDNFIKVPYVKNVVTFTKWLDRIQPSWKYFNVYNDKTRVQVASFTNKNKPKTKCIE